MADRPNLPEIDTYIMKEQVAQGFKRRQTKETPSANSETDSQRAHGIQTIRAIHETDRQLQKQQKELSAFYAIITYEALDVIRTVHIAHFDNGAMTSTTHFLPALWHYRPFDTYDPPTQPIKVADHGTHTPVGFGFLRIPSTEITGYSMVFCLYTPTILATIVSPYAIGLQYRARGYTCSSDFHTQVCAVTIYFHKHSGDDITFPLHSIRGLLCSEPLFFPNDIKHAEPSPPELWDRIPNITNPVNSPPYIRQVTQHYDEQQQHRCSPDQVPKNEDPSDRIGAPYHYNHRPKPQINGKHPKNDLRPP
jgi:hypothetical protein